jgi:hypothetical protein
MSVSYLCIENNLQPWEVEYGGKKPMKFSPLMIDEEESGRYDFILMMHSYILFETNTKSIDKLEHESFYKLVEKISILVCKQFAPTKRMGITKPEVRTLVEYTIKNNK